MPGPTYFSATRSGTDIVAIIDPRHAAKQLIYERLFRSATLIAAVLVLLILGGVAVSVLRRALAAPSHLRFSIVHRQVLDSVNRPIRAVAAAFRTLGNSLDCL